MSLKQKALARNATADPIRPGIEKDQMSALVPHQWFMSLFTPDNPTKAHFHLVFEGTNNLELVAIQEK